MDKASGAILALKPVTFHYKSNKTDTPQFGLIAEEVAAVNPDLVVRDEKGEIYTVRYDAVNAMLLNEFLKEHGKVQEQDAIIAQVKSNTAKQEATIAELKSGMETLTAMMKEQASQIQKVTSPLAAANTSRGGLEESKPAPQTVLNNQ
jgi:septal ring factor EnvC (AmiA/AmiB activator)